MSHNLRCPTCCPDDMPVEADHEDSRSLTTLLQTTHRIQHSSELMRQYRKQSSE